MLSIQEELVCRFCDQPLEPSSAVCHSCGSLLDPATDLVVPPPHDTQPRCPDCSATLVPGFAVCPSCGSLF